MELNDMNVFQRLHYVMERVKYVQKDDSKKKDLKFSYVPHDVVARRLHDALTEARLVCVVNANHRPIEMVEVKTKDRSRIEFRADVDVSLTFVNIDNPQDQVTYGPFQGTGADNSDKGTGKAYSYALKTALLKSFLLESGEREENDEDVMERSPAVSGAEKKILEKLQRLDSKLKGAESVVEKQTDPDSREFAKDSLGEIFEEMDAIEAEMDKAKLPDECDSGDLLKELDKRGRELKKKLDVK